ncbi:amidase [Paraburkholderia sp. UCT2]|uniref:amidase n=1 Tax=Paraburkholderia sp. UCT2 TaxID=2615208 RepID=UPI001654E196|nr:amidase [Paraburkholderia sp. UCT2]MBC8727764.1 amidase [Paraburkholderia sp. UCT2]
MKQASGATVREIAAALSCGDATALQVVNNSVELAEGNNAWLKSLITVTSERGRLEAKAADERRRSGSRRGMLDGMPYAAKDAFETKGIRTTAGSKVLAEHVPRNDAALIRKLTDAGAALVGKANMHEFAYGATGENQFSGTTVNPWDERRLAGGSSGGSAAAVAAGIVPFALGTDTGGSVRVPAALCGVAGFKPTFGLLDSTGVIPFCWTLDHAGIIAGNADDVSVVADCLTDLDIFGGESSLRSLRIGLPTAWTSLLEPSVRAGYERAIAALRASGATFHDVELPDRAESRTVSLTIQLAEALAYHSSLIASSGERYGADIRSGFVLGQQLSAESYVQCQRLLSAYRSSFKKLFKDIDAILTPTCPIVAPETGSTRIPIGEELFPVGNALTLFTSFFNLVGAPAIALPAGRDERGLPVSVQLIGAPNKDRDILELARHLERDLAR